MADLILNVDIDESRKRGHLIIDTYEGSIPHLKSHLYSGPLRNINVNGIQSVDNLSMKDLELVKELLNEPSNVQVGKHQYALGIKNLIVLATFARLDCLFSKQSKNPMYQIDSVVFANPPQVSIIQLQGACIGSNKNVIYVLVNDAVKEETPLVLTAKAYVDIAGREHHLRLVFDYESHIIEYGFTTTNDSSKRDFRDYGYESRSIATIKSCGWRQDSHAGFYYTGSSFVKDVNSLIEDGITVYTNDGKTIAKGDFAGVRVSYGIDWFDISGEVSVADQKIDIAKLIDLNKTRTQWIEVNGTVLSVPDELRLAKYKTSCNGKPKLAHEQVASAIELAYKLNGSKVEGLDNLINYKDVELDIDKSITNILRPYQETGVKWLVSLNRNGFGGCLADDMGLGKTLQVIAYLSDMSMHEARTLVVAPRTLLANWQREFCRFAPSVPVRIYHGPNRALQRDDMPAVLLTTYGTLLNDADLLGSIDFTNLVIDEAQYIRNPSSKIHNAMKRIKANTRIILTGTPVENNVKEYWGLMKLVNPDVFAGVQPFGKRVDSKIALEKVRRLTSPFLLRRMKKDVLPDLPEKREQTIYCSMDDDQRAYYETMLASIRQDLVKKGSRFEIMTNSAILKGLLYLQEICCHPSLLEDDLNPRKCNSSVKLDLLLEMLDELRESGHKVVVFSRFTRMLRLIETHLIRRHYNYYYLDGSTIHRLDVVDEFESCNSGIFLISLKAGGTGINLVSADTVIIYDPWWNPAEEEQAEDRVFRMGQSKNVMVYRLIVEETIEEKVQLLQQEKKQLYEQILDGHEIPMSLTAEEMMELLMG